MKAVAKTTAAPVEELSPEFIEAARCFKAAWKEFGPHSKQAIVTLSVLYLEAPPHVREILESIVKSKPTTHSEAKS